MSTTIGHAGANRPGAHVVADRALRAGRDDELVGSRAVRGERLRHRGLHALDRQRLAVELEAVAVRGRTPQQVARGVHPGLGRPLRAAHARRARRRSSPAAGRRRSSPSTVSSTPSARSRSASQSGNVSGTTALVTPRLLTARERDLVADLRVREARRDQLVDAELLGRMQLEEPERRQPRHLHRADLDVLDPVPLGVEERIRDARAAPRGAARASETCRRT